MKKVGYSILLLLLSLPLNVVACPHTDQDGKPHLQTYNESYTLMNMIYPKGDYLYIKEVPMNIQSQTVLMDENDILLETFSFPLLMDKATFMTYYWFLDDSLTDPANADKEVETTIEDIEYLDVKGDGYDLKVNFNNVISKGLEYQNEHVQEIYYDIIIDDLSEDNKVLSTINKYNFAILSTKVINLEARYNITEVKDYKYETYYKEIETLEDEVTIKLNAVSNNGEIVAINLSNDITNDNYIDVVKEGEYYTFNTKESGTYILTQKIYIEEEQTKDIDETINEKNDANIEIEDIKENNNNNLIYIISGSLILILILVFVKKRK